MVTFNYVIKDDLGIHARPTGILIREVKKYNSIITFSHGEKKASGEGLFAIMKLSVKHGNTLGVTVEGDDEEKAAAAIKNILEENL
jgi:phosphocarrier protein